VYPNMFASMAYLKQNFRETRQWLSQAEAASNSKDNINSNLKILEIMSFLEESEWDMATIKLENLRKFHSNHTVDTRNVEIYKLLNRLVRHDFDFLKQYQETQHLIQQMNQKYPWAPFSMEMIRFDVWFQAKAERIDYWQLFQELVGNS
ncbi:MAG: hypothetical protein ACKVTZ_00500, partial [Bacteroidia bacterium]